MSMISWQVNVIERSFVCQSDERVLEGRFEGVAAAVPGCDEQ
jgi:hypothetical protein